MANNLIFGYWYGSRLYNFCFIQNHIKTWTSIAGDATPFDFSAPTAMRNAAQAVRAMQLRRAILLEGSPGTGKTALVAALAAASGAFLARRRCLRAQLLPSVCRRVGAHAHSDCVWP